MELGKIPPQAINSEEYILANLVAFPAYMSKVMQYITGPEMFYNEFNGQIFEAIVKRYRAGKKFDMVLISQELENPYELTRILSSAGSGNAIEEHCQIVYEQYCRREFIHMSDIISASMFDESIDFLDSLNEFEKRKEELLSFASKDEQHISETIRDMVSHSTKLNKNEIPMGIPTGYTYFDKFSGGIQRGDLIVIAGETSNGKTTLALNIAKNSAERGTRIAIFSYEMTLFQLSARMVAHSQRISSKDIIRGDIDEANLVKISNNAVKLRESHTYLVKPFGTSLNRLIQDITRMAKLYKLDAVEIDYLQLISNAKRNANQADMVGEICNRLKSLAVELNIAIILLCQLSRDRTPRPTLGRLKGSGDIENAADVVMFTYLPYKYGFTAETVEGETKQVEENAIIIVAKGRNIGTTEFLLEFKKEIPAFFNYFEHEELSEIMPAEIYTEARKSDPFE